MAGLSSYRTQWKNESVLRYSVTADAAVCCTSMRYWYKKISTNMQKERKANVGTNLLAVVKIRQAFLVNKNNILF